MPKVLITGGRAPVSLELARLFHKSGYDVYGADSTPASFLLVSNAVKKNFVLPSPRFHLARFQQALLDIIIQNHMDLVVPTCEEIFYIANVKHHFPDWCTIFVDELTLLDELHNKWTFVQMAKRYELSVPRTELFQGASEKTPSNEFGFPVVLKPIYSRFGDKVIIVESQQKLEELKSRGHLSGSPMVIQQYVPGKQICTYSIARHGRILAHAAYPTRYIWGRGTSMYFEYIDHEPSLKWVQTFVRESQFTGQIAFDFIEQADGSLFALECNPRATSGVHLLSELPGFANCFDSGAEPLVGPHSPKISMLALAMLFYAARSVRTKGDFKKWKEDFHKSQDVIWTSSDPFPTLMQVLILIWFPILSVFYGVSVTAATTFDIEYGG